MRFSDENQLDFKDSLTIVRYKDWVESHQKNSIATIVRKLSNIKVYLKEGWNIIVFTNFYKGKTEERNPHIAYKEEEVLELIQGLQA